MDAGHMKNIETTETDGSTMTRTSKLTKRQRYERRHAEQRASLREGDPLKTVLDGLGGLSEPELAFVQAYRQYTAAADVPLVVPEPLLEHGFVSLARAAKLLNTTVADLANREGRYQVWGHRLPILKNKTVPLSELRREFQRRHDERVRRLANEAAKVLNDAGRGETPNVHWEAGESMFGRLFDDGPDGIRGYDFEGVAEQLGVSKAEAKRLMDGTLFCWSPRQGRSIVTEEELDAYKRMLERKKMARSGSELFAAHLRSIKVSGPPTLMPRKAQGKAVAA